jgi:hypothetical protein
MYEVPKSLGCQIDYFPLRHENDFKPETGVMGLPRLKADIDIDPEDLWRQFTGACFFQLLPRPVP